MKKTVVIGASPDTSKYAYLAAMRLTEKGHEMVPLGIRTGELFGKTILDIRKKPDLKGVDTVTLYIGPHRQPEWMDYILGLKPRRIIFNPGTENADFEKKAGEAGVEVVEGCTLVMLGSGQF